ncbi:DUF488 domain-containing protein [Mesorhizobium sp. B283B1A]|uniref:DUF488 domain-containing protein n=1 Tax=Mesorhizobium TaxID=68287 RepID=UPI001CD17EDC|nr:MULTISPECIES: DUF488 domain-containing protein [Mesorhizobium]MCA0047521.1 DUF488 domain-containing protein [Mesorhizobium sp. B283B1A]UQS63169.1 DUF488 domain-containing protein [Mesorhizobium opportunistum]
MALLTIGYEGSEIDDFVSVLKAAKVELLVDVRDLPLSRKPGFSKNSLRSHLQNSSIDYRHTKILGDPREGRLAARSGDRPRFERIFRSHIANEAAGKIIRELALQAETKNICLMCFERDHKDCHRSIICEEILKIKKSSIKNIGVPKGFRLKAA